MEARGTGAQAPALPPVAHLQREQEVGIREATRLSTRTRARRFGQENAEGWVLVAPLLVLSAVFLVYPVAMNFVYSLTEWRGFGQATFIGLRNFQEILQDDRFYLSLRNIGILILYVPLGVLLPLMISDLLRDGLRGWRVFRTLIYIPNVLGVVIIGTIFQRLLAVFGPVNDLLVSLGFEERIAWTGSRALTIHVVGVLFMVWQRIGFGIVYFLAAMASVDQDYYDAAKIDGANWFQTFFYVTIPGIRFAVEFFTVLAFIRVFARMFGFIYSFTFGGPGNSTNTLEFGIYVLGFQRFRAGYASAWAVVLFIFCAVISIFQVRLMRGRLR